MCKGEAPLGSIYGVDEIEAVNRALTDSMDQQVGFFGRKEEEAFENDFAKLCGVKYAVALNSCGSALNLAIKALDIKPGDEIISCAVNFHGTHLAVIGSGARLVLCEPDPETINIDFCDVEKKLNKKTKAVLVTHMNGLAADTDLLKKIINRSKYFKNRKEKPKIICDAARACGTTYKGRHVGGGVWATVFSFDSYKMITTLGEGGMLVTDNRKLADKIRDFRSFGRRKNWGANFQMTKIQAVIGRVQLAKLEKLVSLRRSLAKERNRLLSCLSEISIQKDTPYSRNSYYLYTVILPVNPGGKKRDGLMKMLKEKYGIGSVVANQPTYKNNKFIKSNIGGQKLPLADSLGSRILCIYIHPSMTRKINKYVMESFIYCFRSVFKK